MNIHIDDDNIDVKDIMRQIKEKTSKINTKDDLISKVATSINHSNYETISILERHQYMLNRTWNYSSYTSVTSHRKMIGPIIVIGKKILRKLLHWYVNPIVEKQNDFNAEVTRTLNSIIEEIKISDTQTRKITQEEMKDIHQLKELILLNGNQAKENESLNKELHSIKLKLEDLTIQVEEEKQKTLTLELTLNQVNSQKEQTEITNKTLRVATERLKRIERTLKQKSINIDSLNEFTTKDDTMSESIEGFDYYLFEEYYRGSRDEIKNRQRMYLEYFKVGQHVADLGCGRGEFSELLIENDIKVTSVDMNDEMVLYCQDRGFPILKMDILSYLRSLEPNSIDGIYLGQVIEHLNINQLIELVNLSYDKLKPTGLFIAETPNPQCLSIFTQSFYMDPSHVKPVHAYTAKFMLESAGFHDININYLSPNDAFLQLPPIQLGELQSESLDKFNQTINRWNDVIFGYQDYNIIGRK